MRHATNWTLRTLALLAGVLAIAAAPARAQSPTPEGTTITNTATVDWTDANNNDYTAVSASVSVTVGFQAGVDVVGPATAAPSPGSADNTISFTLDNVGNGTDSLSVSESIGAGGSVTNVRYVHDATTYSDLASLNTALAGVAVAAGGSITVDVVYDVPAGQGGESTDYTLTGTSRRDATTSDGQTTTVTPAEAAAVSVTPDGGAVDRLPSGTGGTQYTETFTVTNSGNGPEDFDLTASADAEISLVSVDGTAGTTATISLTAGASQTVDVVYTIDDNDDAATGSTHALQLQAVAQSDGSVTDGGDVTVTIVRANLTITKAAFRSDQTTQITGTDEVLPGETIYYRVTVQNSGDSEAQSVQVTDALPSEVTFVSTSGDGAGPPAWNLSESAGTVTGDLTTLAVGASRFFWIEVTIN